MATTTPEIRETIQSFCSSEENTEKLVLVAVFYLMVHKVILSLVIPEVS